MHRRSGGVSRVVAPNGAGALCVPVLQWQVVGVPLPVSVRGWSAVGLAAACGVSGERRGWGSHRLGGGGERGWRGCWGKHAATHAVGGVLLWVWVWGPVGGAGWGGDGGGGDVGAWCSFAVVTFAGRWWVWCGCLVAPCDVPGGARSVACAVGAVLGSAARWVLGGYIRSALGFGGSAVVFNVFWAGSVSCFVRGLALGLSQWKSDDFWSWGGRGVGCPRSLLCAGRRWAGGSMDECMGKGRAWAFGWRRR